MTLRPLESGVGNRDESSTARKVLGATAQKTRLGSFNLFREGCPLAGAKARFRTREVI